MNTNKPPNNINTPPQILPTTKQITNVASTQESKTEVVIAKAVNAYKL